MTYKISAVLIILLYSFNSSANEFKVNVPQGELMNTLGLIKVSSLAVGESAYLSKGESICVTKPGQFRILKDSMVVTERSKYSGYYLIKRLPSDMVSIKLISREDAAKWEEIEAFLKSSIAGKVLSCEGVNTLLGLNPASFFTVQSVEGVTSIKDLVSLYKKEKDSH